MSRGNTNGSAHLPRDVTALIAAVAFGGAIIVAWRAVQAATWTTRDFGTWFLLAGGIALAEQFPIRLKLRSERLAFSLTEAVWVAGLMTARPSVIALAVGAGILAGHGARRKALPKLVFNVGQFLLSVTVAQMVAAYAVVNAGSVALVVSRVERLSFRSVLMPPLGANGLHFAGNAAIGLTGATMWATSAFAIPVLALLSLMAWVTYRTTLENVQRTRLATIPAFVPPDRAWRPATIS
jgi:hypothetical protein